MAVTIQRIGGPTALLGWAGLRILVDPAFDAPGVFERPNAPVLTKLDGPAVPAEQIGATDLVLLSHDQHADNFDASGGALLPRAERVLTTMAAAERLGARNVTGMDPWDTLELPRGDDGEGVVTVTAVRAQHGPVGPGGTDYATNPVNGFLLTAPGEPTLHVTGDNASLDVVREIAERAPPIDVLLLFAGGTRIPGRFNGDFLTLSAPDAVEAVRIFGASVVVPVHLDGWQHFTYHEAELRAAFDAAGLQDRLLVPPYGETVSI